jgi:hypothetical protein
MKIYSINRSESQFVEYIPEPFEGFDRFFYESILLEGQEDYLKKKYPEVDMALIQQAIEFDRKNAEKLVMGLRDGVINTLDQDAVAAVAELDPFAKKSNKSQADLEYEAAIKSAKEVHPKYWQWIIGQRKKDPDAEFDEGLFHYFEGEGLTGDEIKKLTLEKAREKSERWHRQQFASQEEGGTYKLSPDSPDAIKTGPFAWVPVYKADAKTEGKKMQNCIGSFCRPSADLKIFSMRNKFNNPHVSLSMSNENGIWAIREIKGKQNKLPADKYTPFVLEFADKVLQKGAGIRPGSDFWRLPIDFDDYIQFYTGDITGDRNILNKITDETLNAVVQRNGLGRVDENIINRLTPETVIQLLENNPAAANSQFWDDSEFLMLIIKKRLINEDRAKALAEQGKLHRGAQMTVLAAYHPDQFVATIDKVPVEDLAAAFKNYKHAVESLQDPHEVFTRIVTELIDKGIFNLEYGKPLLGAMPARDLLRLIPNWSDGFGQQSWQTKYRSQQYLNAVANALANEVVSDNFETKYAIVSQFPQDYAFPDELADCIVYSTTFEQLPQLYQLGNSSLNRKMKHMLAGIQEIKAEEAQISYPKLSGGSEQLLSGADQVLALDDPVKLRELRKATKSRGIKKLVDRKLARLQRLQRV